PVYRHGAGAGGIGAGANDHGDGFAAETRGGKGKAEVINDRTAGAFTQLAQIHRVHVLHDGLLPYVDVAAGDAAPVAGATAEVDRHIPIGIDEGRNILLAVEGDSAGGVHQQFAGREPFETGRIGQGYIAVHEQAYRSLSATRQLANRALDAEIQIAVDPVAPRGHLQGRLVGWPEGAHVALAVARIADDGRIAAGEQSCRVYAAGNPGLGSEADLACGMNGTGKLEVLARLNITLHIEFDVPVGKSLETHLADVELSSNVQTHHTGTAGQRADHRLLCHGEVAVYPVVPRSKLDVRPVQRAYPAQQVGPAVGGEAQRRFLAHGNRTVVTRPPGQLSLIAGGYHTIAGGTGAKCGRHHGAGPEARCGTDRMPASRRALHPVTQPHLVRPGVCMGDRGRVERRTAAMHPRLVAHLDEAG